MTEKELREIKRRFRPDRSNVARIVGCFVNSNGQILNKITQPLGITEDLVSEKLLSTMKKTLSGSLGTNLNDISFSTKQVLESGEHKLLTRLVKSHLQDAEALDEFYGKVIESVHFDGNFVILLANDIYDVVTKGRDGESGDSTESFNYVICAVSPVKSLPEALSFRESDSLFHALTASAVLSAPELGFMFPTFDDRRTNIYGALYYTRSVAESYPEFTERIFASEPIMPPKTQRVTFNECLSSALKDECSFEVVRSVQGQIEEMVQAHKESGDPEPLTVTRQTVHTILANSGVAEEKLERLDAEFDESFGKNATLRPKNIVKLNKFEMSTPEVSIKVDPEHKDLVTTQVINNVRYVMIKITSGVEVNGINLHFDEE